MEVSPRLHGAVALGLHRETCKLSEEGTRRLVDHRDGSEAGETCTNLSFQEAVQVRVITDTPM